MGWLVSLLYCRWRLSCCRMSSGSVKRETRACFCCSLHKQETTTYFDFFQQFHKNFAQKVCRNSLIQAVGGFIVKISDCLASWGTARVLAPHNQKGSSFHPLKCHNICGNFHETWQLLRNFTSTVGWHFLQLGLTRCIYLSLSCTLWVYCNLSYPFTVYIVSGVVETCLPLEISVQPSPKTPTAKDTIYLIFGPHHWTE